MLECSALRDLYLPTLSAGVWCVEWVLSACVESCIECVSESGVRAGRGLGRDSGNSGLDPVETRLSLPRGDCRRRRGPNVTDGISSDLCALCVWSSLVGRGYYPEQSIGLVHWIALKVYPNIVACMM